MLSLEQAPPISASFRFFFTAPWFGVAAGLLLAWSGPEALSSRWTPAALALTHLLTTGFLLQAMCGALLQFIPVATGANVWRPLLLARIVHPALFAGAVALAFSLATGRLALLPWSELLLGSGLALFCAVLGYGLFRARVQGVSLPALRIAVVGLAVTTAIGLLLAQAIAGHFLVADPNLADLHAAWGLGGWALMLLAGVSFTVVPMFQLTPPYPRWLPRTLPLMFAISLGLATAAVLPVFRAWLWIGAIAIAALAASGFALATLLLQHRRRRSRVDATYYFFRGAMVCLIAAATGWVLLMTFPALGAAPRFGVCIGVLCLAGVFVSAISGMLYKIVPFVIWLKLAYRSGPANARLSIHSFISQRAMNAQMVFHFLAVCLLLACTAAPVLVRPAGVAFALSSLWLGLNLLGAGRTFVRLKGQNLAAAAIRGW